MNHINIRVIQNQASLGLKMTESVDRLDLEPRSDSKIRTSLELRKISVSKVALELGHQNYPGIHGPPGPRTGHVVRSGSKLETKQTLELIFLSF